MPQDIYVCLIVAFFGIPIIGCDGEQEEDFDMLTSTKFAQCYIQFLQENNPHLVVKVEEEHSLKIELKDRELSIFLNNAYDEYLNNPDDIDRIIERYCSTVLETAVNENNHKRRKYSPRNQAC